MSENWAELESRYFFPVGKRLPVTLVKGQGCRVWDEDGREYLDCVAGIAAVSLGHCHPEVVKAVQEQAASLMHVSNYYYTQPQIRLAQLLCEHSGLDKVFFCNSGAEAVEGCIKLARKWGKEKRDGAFEIIVAEDAFHGRTLATVTATATEKYRAPFTPLVEGFVRVPFNDVEAIKRATTGKTAAVLLEPIQGEGGVIVPDDDYLPQVRAWCDEAGILLMADEVQSGIGRAGALFAHQLYGIEVDVMALAKGLGGGFPIGAFLAKDHCAVLGPGEHGTTFGGNPLATHVGYTVLKHIIENDLPAQVAKKGEHLERRLHSLADRHPMVKEVRGKGLLWAIELDRAAAEEAVRLCLDEGLLANNVKPTALRLMPPLTITEEELDRAVEIVDRVLGRIESGTPK
ncbi:MAG: aspartate aminotransferase family protein [Chloroflexi bacterium]|nr:aspartate aminotransferase family protein [Chloroflexota bacterium]